MALAALVARVVTALVGFVLLAHWIARGGLRQQQTGTTRFPAPPSSATSCSRWLDWSSGASISRPTGRP